MAFGEKVAEEGAISASGTIRGSDATLHYYDVCARDRAQVDNIMVTRPPQILSSPRFRKTSEGKAVSRNWSLRNGKQPQCLRLRKR